MELMRGGGLQRRANTANEIPERLENACCIGKHKFSGSAGAAAAVYPVGLQQRLQAEDARVLQARNPPGPCRLSRGEPSSGVVVPHSPGGLDLSCVMRCA